MAQRTSGYPRIADENYATIAWPIVAVLKHLRPPVKSAWDPCARGSGAMTATLRACGVEAFGTGQDFFTVERPPYGIDTIICNPPYGGAETRGTSRALHRALSQLEGAADRYATAC